MRSVSANHYARDSFHYFLDTEEWKPYRSIQKVTWKMEGSSNKNRSIKERLERIRLINMVDLEKNRDWHTIFSGNLDARKILAELEIFLNAKVTPGSTLLFLDEIQSCPRAIMSLRYFYEQMPELHVIAAGSLLDFVMFEIPFPVGRVQFLDMFPLNFAEYLMAIGRDEAAKIIMSEPQSVSPPIHKLLLDELKIYCFIGGMPESVKTYSGSRSLKESFLVHRELCSSFRHDFSKYAPRTKNLNFSLCITLILYFLEEAPNLGVTWERSTLI